MRWTPQNWNDVLSLILMVGIMMVWIFKPVDGEVNGALISVFTLVAQFYYRKAKTEK